MFGRIGKLPLWRPLARRSFRLLFFGQGSSLLADQFFLVALTLLTLRVAGPGFELGAVLAVAAGPGAVLMPLGGWASDRFPPASILVVSNTGRAALVAVFCGFVLLEATQLWHLYALAGALGVLDALHYPASLSVVPAFVEKEKLEAANALVYRGPTFLILFALFGFALAAMGFVPNLLIASAVAAAMGGTTGYFGVALVAWIQDRAEERFLGRVMSLVVLATIALEPFSYAMAGVLTEAGIEALFVSAGALILLAVLAGAASRTVRSLN